jgi:hypothetical protein
VHSSLLKPSAKEPCAHGTQGELAIELRIPCPGMHTQCFICSTSLECCFVHGTRCVFAEVFCAKVFCAEVFCAETFCAEVGVYRPKTDGHWQ